MTTTTTPTSSSETKTFSERMRQQLTAVRDSVDRTLTDIQGAGSKATAKVSEDLKTRRDEAQATMEARRQEMEHANARVKTGAEAKKAEAASAIAEWKTRLDLQRLEHRADHAEEYASATTLFAWGAVQEADAAILDAIVARADFEEAKIRAAVAKA